jgi:peroxiredoxin
MRVEGEKAEKAKKAKEAKRITLVFALFALSPFRLASSQADPVRGYPMGDPRPGRDAPAFVLPYVRAEGPGPVDQPFAIRAELGRVVVLAFCPPSTDSTTVALLRGLTERYDSLFVGEVVVAVGLPGTSHQLVETARQLGVPFKLLADSTSRVRRLFGVDSRECGAYVVGPTGRIDWRMVRFPPRNATSYDRLRDAVRLAWGPPPTR